MTAETFRDLAYVLLKRQAGRPTLLRVAEDGGVSYPHLANAMRGTRSRWSPATVAAFAQAHGLSVARVQRALDTSRRRAGR